MSGGERAQMMMKQGRVGVRAHCAFSSLALCSVRVLEGGVVVKVWCSSPEVESHSQLKVTTCNT